MSSPESIALAATAEAENGLTSVLVGGNAVNLHAYFRATFDVDLLIPEAQAEGWLLFFQQHGYLIYHRTANFIRLRFEADPGAVLPVDLMLADDGTFQKIQKESRRVAIGRDLTLAIPSALHLVAMKLHALRSPHRVEQGVDLQDVKHLIKTAKIDCTGSEFTEIMNRYASDTIRTRILRELEEDSGA